MGLNASVYCNCIERGLLNTPHPYPDLLYIYEDGSPDIESTDPALQAEHSWWQFRQPSAHENMSVYSARLGNIDGIGFLRNLFTATSERLNAPALPVLLNNVIYSGTHAGDYLNLEQVAALKEELRNLKRFDFRTAPLSSDDELYIQSFFSELDSLIDASLAMNKPIAF
jgi:hypothetical protein